MLLARNQAFPAAQQVEWHQEVKRLVTVRREDKGRQAGLSDRDPQLFLQLADQALFGRFARFDLAARKLPQSGQLLAYRPLADQHPAIDIDHGGGGDEDSGLGHQRGLARRNRAGKILVASAPYCLPSVTGDAGDD